MDSKKLHIKNMVCDRCILSVREILQRNDVSFHTITLGTIELQDSLDSSKIMELQKEFKKVGFEILSEKNERIVKQIKAIILKEIFESDSNRNQNLSVILTEKLHFDYSHLSAIFSKTEGKSIQKYQNELKVERIKELLEYDELSISEIAADLALEVLPTFLHNLKTAPGLLLLNIKNPRKAVTRWIPFKLSIFS
ncbi:helix-turn-helix domain-containing protein [Gillisia marina]|uniref:helix-turn-helix domain-containing protein n=1 Tax=Gillisia marina TaxID=1167637 RepID=UPI0006834ECE|nr:AraC family transcriptional regulator [Gillisia marina]